MQSSLDLDRESSSLRWLSLADAEIALAPGWLDAGEADALLTVLTGQIAWQRHRLRLFGREVQAPRLSCWIGDPGAVYTWSRTRFEPQPWPDALAELRGRVSEAAGESFNSVLANLYRDGRDSMGWHADDEPELGPQPVIASLSLGAERTFVLRHRNEKTRTLKLQLPHGSLLIMRGPTQTNWRHALPKSMRIDGPRLNLTFRKVSPFRRPSLRSAQSR